MAGEFGSELIMTRFYSIYPQQPMTEGSWAWIDLGVLMVFCKWDQEELMDL